MRCGRLYTWTADTSRILGGHVSLTAVPLLRLDTHGEGSGRLWGRYVRVRNGGFINEPEPATGRPAPVPIGDAEPNADGDFFFEAERGGGRMDKVAVAKPAYRRRYIEASHFGEVNTYFHLDRIAAYVHELLGELNSPPLPRVTAVVNAHHAATERNGKRDGVRRGERWLPFQGGHYRLPSRKYDIAEHDPISPDGEIHLGTGRQLLEHGALVEIVGRRYRANASHNAGILYHEYGHHLTRHTADFRANALRPLHQQDNRKTSLDEGVCDYWAATMLGTAHIWALHHRHDEVEVHPRSLTSAKTIADFASRPGADPHANGTIWAAALWDMRTRLAAMESDGERRADLLVLQSLLLMGRLDCREAEPTRASIRRTRSEYAVALAELLRANQQLYAGRHQQTIVAVFADRGILHAHDRGRAEKPITGLP